MQYPLYVSFKVDHYLDAEYDRKVTEIFMRTEKIGYFQVTIALLELALQRLENAWIIRDICELANTGSQATFYEKTCTELDYLKYIIDSLNLSSLEALPLKISMLEREKNFKN